MLVSDFLFALCLPLFGLGIARFGIDMMGTVRIFNGLRWKNASGTGALRPSAR